jgi:protein-L-isoaspartate O-methyltransferase
LGESRDAQQLVQIDKTEQGFTEKPLLAVRFVPLVHGRAGVGARQPKAARGARREDA